MIEQQADGTQRWLQCKACQTEKMRKQRMRRLVEMSPQYQEALLSAHPMEVQTLSLMDVSVNVKERVYGHACGEVRSDSVLLSAPLIARGEMPNLQDRASEQVQQLLATLKETSPLVKQCLTLAEKPVRQHGLALLPPESIADITEAVKARDPEYTGGLEHRAMETVFSLVATADAYPEVPLQPPLSFCVGKVQLRKGTRDIDVVTDSSGLPLRPGGRRRYDNDNGNASDADGSAGEKQEEGPVIAPDAEQVTLELAVLCALFPHATGHFNSGRLGDYLRYRLMCGFSPFTLFKPYIMVLFLVRQCHMLNSQCGEGVLERDMAAYRRAHPDEDEEEAVRHALKHAVPSTIPGSPAWHYNALQDLLAMVEENGMPDLFWTVTMDEVSQLKWQSVIDMEKLLPKFCDSFKFQVSAEK